MRLELDGVSHRYGDERAVEGVSLAVEAGELVGLLGPSGCGKTTLVQAVAGHVRPTAGRVLLRGADVTDDPPETRNVGVVFQQSTLFPHMTVRENVAYGLAGQATDRVAACLDLVALDRQRTAYPAELSGGQRRRAELARALAPRPDILLLDEPLSALDRTLRERLRDEIARIQRETGVTTLFVTHDQTDAMALADRLVLLDAGQVAGVGRPRELYHSPPTRFVASFLGRSNSLTATVVETDPPAVALAETRLTAPELSGVESLEPGATVDCHARPEHITLSNTGDVTPAGPAGQRPPNSGETADTDTGGQSPGGDGAVLTLAGAVARVTDVGHRYDVTVQSRTGAELLVETSAEPPSPGTSVTLGVPRDHLTLFD